MKYLERNKGITLIALIVTIVVLLILAGVTINAITGSESAMEKATEAREKDKQGAELEAIKLAVVNSVANGLTGLVDTDSLKTGLVGLIQENPEDVIVGNGPWVVTSPSGLVYEINQNTSVNKLNPLNISSNLTIAENKVKTLTVKKYGSAVGKQVSWSKEGNIAFVTDSTGNTTIENPTTDTIYIKAGAYDDGTSGKVIISANDEESQDCSITVAEREWSKIGESVTYQSKYEKDNNITIGWRLFYRDEEDNGYTYIIANKLSSEYEPEVNSENTGLYKPSNYSSSYTKDAFSSNKNVAKKMNTILANTDSTKELFEANSLQDNMKVLAWYCDTEVWKDFSRHGTDASQNDEYAIACPPIELFVKSYNLASEDAGRTSRFSTPTVGRYGYKTVSGFVKKEHNNGIYTKDEITPWWIASPAYDYWDWGLFVGCGDSLSRGSWISCHYLNNTARAIRPLVAIPNANFDFATLTVK